MIEIGRVCLKTSGRDSGEIAVVIKNVSDNIVMVDGNVRRRNCNILHLEPTKLKLKIKEDVSTKDLLKVMKDANLEVKKNPEKKVKSKKPVEKKEKTSKKDEKKSSKKDEKKAKK